MKINDLINQLENVYTEHGDLDVKLILPDGLIVSIEGAVYTTTENLESHVIREDVILRWRGDNYDT